MSLVAEGASVLINARREEKFNQSINEAEKQFLKENRPTSIIQRLIRHYYSIKWRFY
ncbi:hypothetical protein [Neobacillus mesonae]|uniref:hypothetical protein n=1 Tax=Neobacillus mesonae TaxID=1193713 RepID=UPI00399CD02E